MIANKGVWWCFVNPTLFLDFQIAARQRNYFFEPDTENKCLVERGRPQ